MKRAAFFVRRLFFVDASSGRPAKMVEKRKKNWKNRIAKDRKR